ncbi:hypothetical protein COZ63_02660 [Candidatus Berkelbacteria bacterium CG_4_8_14_3_um_filter_42_13]|uniref:O-antigen ligase-related domain-containing protein n=1 Tax=Candidatus Berkelbacteria bacterium CG_4_8_14_3_um_filter_42_13 TaxID=1974505 RepID=A0A2M7K103_9BACT|nr:MAG: hypothetical protein COZ63_02660 [Candidatus Berkelbacteria bacterium CG_4_8_14_3_um_filter_42_13]
MSDNIKKFSNVLIVLFFLFLPFERLLTFEFFGLTAKISFFLLMILVLFFLAKLPRIKFAPEEKILLLFGAISYLSAFWSIDFKRSLIISTIYLLVFFGFFALRRQINEKNSEIIKLIVIYFGALLCLFALWQYFADLYNLSAYTFLRPEYQKVVFGFPRPQATFLEPLYFANFLLLPTFFTAERLLKDKKIYPFMVINLFLMMLVVVLTLSRGAYFAFAFAAIILAIFIIVRFKEFIRRLWLTVFIVLLGIVAGVMLIYLTVPRQNFSLFVTHTGISDAATGGSTLGRLYTSELALSQSLKYPLGIGAGAFGALPEFDNLYEKGIYQTVGSLYPEILVEEGVLGFLLFAAFIWLLLRHLWKSTASGKPVSSTAERLEGLIYLAILLAILVQAVSFSSLYILPIWAFFALAWPVPPTKLQI